MPKLKIDGGHTLSGDIYISGSKNSAVALLPASLLCQTKSKIFKVPKIRDIEYLLKILEVLNCKYKIINNEIEIDTSNLKNAPIPENLSEQMRASYYFMGTLLARFKHVEISFPGGCNIGARPIDLHIKGFESLGAKVQIIKNKYIIDAKELTGARIYLDFASVGATINIMLAATYAKGCTIIENSAREPEIVDLQNFLNKMGAKIKGAGTDEIEIEGTKRLKEISYNIMPDRIETGTFLCLAAKTGGKIELEKTNPNHLTPVISKLEEAGNKIEIKKETIKIEAPKKLKAIDIKTMPYPGFPTDMQSIMASTFSIAKGTTIIVENIFENRYKYVQELNKMGAKITVEGKSAIIRGTRKLYGANVKATDLRGGAALVLAAMAAKGTTIIENIEYILRGYEELDEKIRQLGGNIEITKLI